MKKRYVVGATILALLGLGTSACSNDSSSSSSHSSKTEKVKNAVSNTKSDVSVSKNGFKGNKYSTESGTITIDKVTNVKVNDDENDPKNFTMVVIEGSFTNNSKKAVSPEDWVMSNLEINQVLPNTERELETPGNNEHDNGTKWDDLFKNSESKVIPGKTIKFALEYDLESKTDKVSNTYSIQAESAEDGHHIGKPYIVNAGSDNFTYKDSDDDDTDTGN